MEQKHIGQFTFYFKPGSVIMLYNLQYISFYSDSAQNRYAIGRFADEVQMLRRCDLSSIFSLARAHGVPIRATSRGSTMPPSQRMQLLQNDGRHA